jgi:hypothetical protein
VFGSTLSQLARRPEPIRALSLTQHATTQINKASNTPLGSIPPATTAAANGAASGASPAQQLEFVHKAGLQTPDMAAGSHALTNLLANDETDLSSTLQPVDVPFERSALPMMAITSAVKKATNVATSVASSILTSSDASRKGTSLMSIPKEIWRLVDVLFHKGLAVRGLFLAPGDPVEMILIREALDTGDAFPANFDCKSYAQVLLDLLSSLREPVIPVAFFPTGSAFRSSLIPLEEWTSHVLKSLIPVHYNTLVYMVRFCREVLACNDQNGVNVDDLAFVLSRSILRNVAHQDAAIHAAMHSDSDLSLSPSASDAMNPALSSVVGMMDDDEGTGIAVATTSLYADKGTRWEPTAEEQANMTRVTAYLIRDAMLM